MPTQHLPELQRTENLVEPSIMTLHGADPELQHLGRRTLLLISEDTAFHEVLSCFAHAQGHRVVRVHNADGAGPVLQALQPTALLLDLDPPEPRAWESAEALLEQSGCPPALLLASRTEQFALWTTLRAGLLLDKSAAPSRVLAMLEDILQQADASPTHRNAMQRALIRWLKPCNRPAPATPTYRFWGINE